MATEPKKDLFPSWSGRRKSLSPPFRGDERPELLPFGEKPLSPPFRGDERAELLPFGEKLVEASHARLA